LSSLGFEVLATDQDSIVRSVLSENIVRSNQSHKENWGRIECRTLDWSVREEDWDWEIEESQRGTIEGIHSQEVIPLKPPFDLIVTADTIFSLEAVPHLLQTIKSLCVLSSTESRNSPLTIVCIERRDPIVVDDFLKRAREAGFEVEMEKPSKVVNLVNGLRWDKEDWEGIEIWKLKWMK
jgi:protein N-lysine methyltransferase METTL21D